MSGSMGPSNPGEPEASAAGGQTSPRSGSEQVPGSAAGEGGERVSGEAPRAEVLDKGAVYDRSRERTERLIRENRNFVADYLDSFVKSLTAMERTLGDEGRSETAAQVHRATGELERASKKVREGPLLSTARQLEARARERPALTLGGAALAGFVLSRALRSRPTYNGQEDDRGESRARTTEDD